MPWYIWLSSEKMLLEYIQRGKFLLKQDILYLPEDLIGVGKEQSVVYSKKILSYNYNIHINI